MADPAAHDDDLLAPSLTVHDDAVGFDRPWSPNYLVMVGAFFGLVPMGILMGENFKRLGKPALGGWVLLGSLALAAALMGVAAFAHLHGLPGLYEAGNDDHRRSFRLVHTATAIALGLAFAHQQRRRWEIFQGHGGESAPLLKDAAVAIVVGFVFQFLVAGGVVMVDSAVTAR